VYCPVNQSSCYWQQGGSYTYQQAKDRCASLKGHIISWNEAAEQLQIENYFKVGASGWCIMAAGWQLTVENAAVRITATSCARCLSVLFCHVFDYVVTLSLTLRPGAHAHGCDRLDMTSV
jgi:hypothetical protein